MESESEKSEVIGIEKYCHMKSDHSECFGHLIQIIHSCSLFLIINYYYYYFALYYPILRGAKMILVQGIYY